MAKVLVRHFDIALLGDARLQLRRARRARATGVAARHGAASFAGIVLAVAACEAYLSEIVAHLTTTGKILPAQRLKIQREDRLWKKFNRLVRLFDTSGVTTSPIYRAFQALIVLRNCLVHRSAEFLTPQEWPKDLRNHRTTIPHVSTAGLDWTSRVLDAGTAAWAVNIATAWLRLVKSHVPEP